MRRILASLWIGLALAGQAVAQSVPGRDASAVVNQMMQAMGGEERWARARFVRFDWAVQRDGKDVANVHHLWDRGTGRYRVEWQSKDGKNVQVLFNLDSRAGRVYVNGDTASAADRKAYLDKGYARFINDSYWLLMPWKLKDPGVHVEAVRDTVLDGQSYDVLHVSFDKVGMTPGDQYWAFVNRQTHMMDRWAYFLQGTEGKPSLEKATPWEWKGWGDMGEGIKLSPERVAMGEEKSSRIHFPVLAVLDRVDDKVFERPDAPLPGAPHP